MKRSSDGTWISVPRNTKLSYRRRCTLVPNTPDNQLGMPHALGYRDDAELVHAVTRGHGRQYTRAVKRAKARGENSELIRRPLKIHPDFCPEGMGLNCSYCRESDSSSGEESDDEMPSTSSAAEKKKVCLPVLSYAEVEKEIQAALPPCVEEKNILERALEGIVTPECFDGGDMWGGFEISTRQSELPVDYSKSGENMQGALEPPFTQSSVSEVGVRGGGVEMEMLRLHGEGGDRLFHEVARLTKELALREADHTREVALLKQELTSQDVKLSSEVAKFNAELALRQQQLDVCEVNAASAEVLQVEMEAEVASLKEELEWSRDMEMNPDETLRVKLNPPKGILFPDFCSKEVGLKRLKVDLGGFPMGGGLGGPTFKLAGGGNSTTFFTARIPFMSVGDVNDDNGLRQFFFHGVADVLSIGNMYTTCVPLSNVGMKKLMVEFDTLMRVIEVTKAGSNPSDPPHEPLLLEEGIISPSGCFGDVQLLTLRNKTDGNPYFSLRFTHQRPVTQFSSSFRKKEHPYHMFNFGAADLAYLLHEVMPVITCLSEFQAVGGRMLLKRLNVEPPKRHLGPHWSACKNNVFDRLSTERGFLDLDV